MEYSETDVQTVKQNVIASYPLSPGGRQFHLSISPSPGGGELEGGGTLHHPHLASPIKGEGIRIKALPSRERYLVTDANNVMANKNV